MNKIITGFVVLIVIIASFFAGYQVHKSRTPVIPTETNFTSDAEVIAAADKQVEASVKNKFFALFDNFTRERDMGAPTILFTDPNSKLIAFYYPTSQETSTEGVYDYKNDIVYKDVAFDNYDSENYSTILAVLDKDTVLVNVTENTKTKLVAMDYKTKKTVKSVNIDLSRGQYVKALSYFPYNNEIMIGIYSPHNSQDESDRPIIYILNTDTFAFNKKTGPQ